MRPLGRLERDEDGTLGHQTLRFGHYLNSPIASHQKAPTQMLLADYSLAEVQLRYAERHRALVP